MVELVPPHGDKLLPLLVDSNEREEGLSEAKSLLGIVLDSKEISDLIMLAMGAFSPLQGFMRKEDYQRVVGEMRLKSGLLWPIPITLSITEEKAGKVKEGQKVAKHLERSMERGI